MSPTNVRHLAAARRLLDRAALALAIGAAAGRFRVELPCQGHCLHEPARVYTGRWEDVGGEVPPPAAVRAIAAHWPEADRAAYFRLAVWLDQAPDRVEHTGLWGRLVCEIAGDRSLRVVRLGVDSNDWQMVDTAALVGLDWR